MNSVVRPIDPLDWDSDLVPSTRESLLGIGDRFLMPVRRVANRPTLV